MSFLSLIKNNIDPNLRNSVNRMEMGFNMCDIFANFQIFSDTIWA